MKAILIKVAILLFISWLKKNKANSFLVGILDATTTKQLIDELEDKSTEKGISDIISDIENETISNIISDIIKD